MVPIATTIPDVTHPDNSVAAADGTTTTQTIIPPETTTLENDIKEKDVTAATVPAVTAATVPAVTPKAPPAKKSKAESKEGPMGELRPTDILAGNYRKRAGNFLYKRLLREYAPDVGKVEMRVLVAKILGGIAAQDPPGRFIREGGDAILSAAQRNQKIARALREVAERASKEESEIPTAIPKGDKPPRKTKSDSDKNEPIGEIRPTDVLTGNYRKRAGNFLYKKLLRREAPNVATEEMRAVVNRVIDGIQGQFPPGRFIREGGGGLLTRGQIHQKVARALREVVERGDKIGEEREPGEKVVKKKSTMSEKQEPMGEIRPTDVLTGNYRKRPGNALFKSLLRQHAFAVGREEMSVVVSRVVDGISHQNPPGRFIREGGGALLTRGQVRQKVARALREVLDRTNAEKVVVAATAATISTNTAVDPLVEVLTEESKVDEAIKEVTEQVMDVPEEFKEEVPEEETKIDEVEDDVVMEEEKPTKKRGKKEPLTDDAEDAKGKKMKKEMAEEAEAEEEEPKTRKSRRGAAESKEEVKPPAKRTRKK